jgi:hypothetical protein
MIASFKESVGYEVYWAGSIGSSSVLLHVLGGPKGRKRGKYQGTVLERPFVVPFRHCLRRSDSAGWGCVGKVRADNLSAVVLSL